MIIQNKTETKNRNNRMERFVKRSQIFLFLYLVSFYLLPYLSLSP